MIIRFYKKNGEVFKDVEVVISENVLNEYHTKKEFNEQFNKAINRYAQDFLGGDVDCYELISWWSWFF